MTRRPIPKNDQQLFDEEMRGVRPLGGGAPRVPNTPPAPLPNRTPLRQSAIMAALGTAQQQRVQALVGDDDSPRGSNDQPRAERVGETIKTWADGIDRERVKALGRGDHPPEATLDLHGARVPDVAARVGAFLRSSQTTQRRVVAIVTGRGMGSGPAGPVIREATIDTLTRACGKKAAVLAFVTAPSAYGGAGAFLVLLRR